MKTFKIGDKVQTNCYNLGEGTVSSEARTEGGEPTQKVIFNRIPKFMGKVGQPLTNQEIEIFTVELSLCTH
tara:strand:- start:286 stop:498 length:213 start_codon:yes stop_codon:yes gene_type:complete